MSKRWVHFGCAAIAMIMIANLQYVWTLFVIPIQQSTGWRLSEIQWALSLFILCETWMMPLEAWLVDRLAPGMCLAIAGLLCGAGWSGMGLARTLGELYLCYSIAGAGAALVYSAAIGTALKWFPDRRGFAAGLMTACFGGGSALFFPLIAYLIRVTNYRTTFLYTGVVQTVVILGVGFVLRRPTDDFNTPRFVNEAKGRVRCTSLQFSTMEMLRTPHFYLLYVSFVLACAGGLMVTAQAAPVGRSLNLGTPVIILALSLGRVFNAAGRIFWGWISDFVGREMAMLVPFLLQATGLAGLMAFSQNAARWYLVFTILIYFTWGSSFSLFPAVVGDYFGTHNASSNYSVVYTAKGVASLGAGGIAALLFERFGSWKAVFFSSAVLAFFSGFLILALRTLSLPSKRPVSEPVSAVREELCQ
jgi:OFA family oxalate/formate antiporter-like MFS transporter